MSTRMSSVWHRRQSSDSESHCISVSFIQIFFFLSLSLFLPLVFLFALWLIWVSSDPSAWPKLSIVSNHYPKDSKLNFMWIESTHQNQIHRISFYEIQNFRKYFRLLSVPGIMQKYNCCCWDFAFVNVVHLHLCHMHIALMHTYLVSIALLLCLSASNLNGEHCISARRINK